MEITVSYYEIHPFALLIGGFVFGILTGANLGILLREWIVRNRKITKSEPEVPISPSDESFFK